jgi:hypothetical protein
MALRKVRELSSAGVMVVDQQYVFLVVGWFFRRTAQTWLNTHARCIYEHNNKMSTYLHGM